MSEKTKSTEKGALSDASTCSITFSLEPTPISKHLNFSKPQDDWDVRAAYTIEEWWDEETGEHHPAIDVPEDRSAWRPEWDGLSMSDFWDDENGEWKKESPKCLMGITSFLCPRRRSNVKLNRP